MAGGASSEDSELGSLDISRGWINFLALTSLGTVFAFFGRLNWLSRAFSLALRLRGSEALLRVLTPIVR